MKTLFFALTIAACCLALPMSASAGEVVTPYSYTHTTTKLTKTEKTACSRAKRASILTVKKHFAYTCRAKNTKCVQKTLTSKTVKSWKADSGYYCSVASTLTGTITTTTP